MSNNANEAVVKETTVLENSEDLTAESQAVTAKKTSLAHRLYTGDVSYDFVGKRKVWYIFSAVLLLICLLGLGLRGLNLGIEFKGGSQFQSAVSVSDKTVDDIRGKIIELNLPEMDDLTVNTLGSDTVQVRTRSLNVDEVSEVRRAIASYTNQSEESITYSLIGPSWGKSVTNKSTVALLVFWALASVVMAVYFRNWKMSLSAMIALLHDLVVTVGIYAIVGFTVSPSTVIGVLTILGYSLYDTVVVFDMVRESTKDIKRKPFTYSQAANKAVNQALIRSINTTIIGLLPVIAIVIMGSFVLKTGPLQDLGMALFVGMIAGTYSSIFLATPMLCQFKEREPEMVAHRATIERQLAKQSGGKTAVAKQPVEDSVEESAKPSKASDQPAKVRVSTNNSANRAQPTKKPRSKRKNS